MLLPGPKRTYRKLDERIGLGWSGQGFNRIVHAYVAFLMCLKSAGPEELFAA